MSSKNLNQTQRLFGDLSLKNKPTVTSGAAAANGTSDHGNNDNGDFVDYRSAGAYKHSSPELHDLIRFQHAIMIKYQHTHDQHFKNIAESLKPQIEDKIRAFHSNHQ